MSEEEKAREIGNRVIRLSALRGELAVARSNHRNVASQLEQAAASAKLGDTGAVWPSSSEFKELAFQVKELEKEAGQLISELQALGADAALFHINGNPS